MARKAISVVFHFTQLKLKEMNDRSSWGALVLLCCLRGSEIGIYREISKAGRPALLGLMPAGELTCGSAGKSLLAGMCHAVFSSQQGCLQIY